MQGLYNPDSKVHGANMGPTWVLSAPDGPRVGPMNLAIREVNQHTEDYFQSQTQNHVHILLNILYMQPCPPLCWIICVWFLVYPPWIHSYFKHSCHISHVCLIFCQAYHIVKANTVINLFAYPIEAKWKQCLTFCRCHFKMLLIEWKLLTLG